MKKSIINYVRNCSLRSCSDCDLNDNFLAVGELDEFLPILIKLAQFISIAVALPTRVGVGKASLEKVPQPQCQILKNGRVRLWLLGQKQDLCGCRNSRVAANSGQNLGFDFLQDCWNDDRALVIVIKKLLVKYPQWGIACVDGELLN
ncbi:hypothetical protein [Nostoc sp.]